MNKIFFAPLLMFILLFTACEEEFNGYEINGEIKGLALQEIVLEFLTPTALEQIDTATTDADGKFSLKGNVKEKGFYRFISGEKFWIVLLDNSKMTFVADANDPKLQGVKISGYKAGEEFQNTINFLIEKQEVFAAESQKMQTLAMSPESTEEDKIAAQVSFKQFQDGIMTDIRTKVDELGTEFPFSAIYLLSSLNPSEDLSYIKEKITSLETVIPTSIYLQNIKEIVTKVEAQTNQPPVTPQNQQTNQGESNANGVAPEIVMNNPEGKSMKLSDLRGKVVLIDFWASWCKPCRRDNPNVVRMYHEYKDKGFDIFSVSLDKNADRWKQAIAQDGLVWTSHVSDLKFWNNAAAKEYGVSSIPATVLIDGEGNIIARNLRGAALEAKIKEVLQ